MRRFYSLLLTAAFLLVGMNVWAAFQIVGGNSYSTLQGAIDAAPAGATTTIEMTASYSGSATAWLVTPNLNDPAKHIILDLKGLVYEYTGAEAVKDGAKSIGIAVAHGTLEIISSNGEAQIKVERNDEKVADMIRVYGTYEEVNAKTGTPFAHLIIGENVEILNKSMNAISVDVMRFGQPALFGLTDANKLPKYSCDFFYDKVNNKASGHGVANGVRLDIYGKVTSEGKYGIKVNGCVRLVKEFVSTGTTWQTNYPYLRDNYEPKYNGGSNNGTYTITSAEGQFSPYVFVHSTGYVSTNATAKKAVAAYSSGYARWRIEGYCGGSTGLYAKSGQIEIVDGVIQSTNTTATQPTAQGSGVTAGGSAIVIESNASYSGYTSVVISGDSKVEAQSGYAIEETITNSDTTKVTSVSIQGGTIQGGDKGAIIVENDTKSKTDTTVTIYGGNYQGAVQVNNTTVETKTISDFIPASETSHTTEVIVDNKVVVVVSAGPAPLTGNKISNQAADKNVKWQGNEYVEDEISGYLKLGEVEINDTITAAEHAADPTLVTGAPREQTLTIHSGATLEATRVVLGSAARIIVEAGGKLIVTGNYGIVAPVVENITLKTSEAAQAILLFNPTVSSNRHPNATVEMHSKAYYDEDADKYIWQRFGVPTYDNKQIKRTDIHNASATPTAWRKISHQEWVTFDANEGMVPFVCYGLTTNQTSALGVYVFECPLMGNDNASLSLADNWNYFANSYMAPIDIKATLGALASNVEGTLYLYRPSDNWWYEINNGAYAFDDLHELPLDIDPMQAFILHRTAEGNANQVINYKDLIYDPIVDPNPAPARSRSSFNKAMIEIAAADGTTDNVRMIEDAQFSADFDNTYDATKYMNENSFNLFAGENLGIMATDNLEGTTLSMTTKDQTSFTMTISHVSGMDYAIRDNLTGTEIAMVEGATYMFSVPANTTVEGRFEIVAAAKMPTAIENIEATVAIKGIYTVSGQFMGYNYHILPNGVYVVDGKKIVK